PESTGGAWREWGREPAKSVADAGASGEELASGCRNLIEGAEQGERVRAVTVSDCSTAPLEIRLFGPFEARLHGRPLPRLRSRKGQWLLASLALRAGRPVERGFLVATFWPG